MEKKFFGVMLLLLFLFASEMNMVAKVEGARCRKPSKYFKGLCGSDKACTTACGQESWPAGRCIVGFRCECQRPC
ncbi:Defensin-like protein AX2 [Bienertia sinuspersici]